MTRHLKEPIALTEFQTTRFPNDAISQDIGNTLWQQYGKFIAVEFPNPKTDNQWELTPQGWVGYIAISEDVTLWLQPKVAIHNLFRMLEYAYRLPSFQLLEGAVQAGTLHDFFERLANILAKRIMDRARKGLYRSYISELSELPYVRGRMDMRRLIHSPWMPNIQWNYDVHTPDVEENQILVWTLMRIMHSDITLTRSLPNVRRAYRAFHDLADIRPFTPADCVGRLYNRLNEDYESLHALCRFFLENTGPSHIVGDRRMLPFLVNMSQLYELFVGEWLKAHLPPKWLIDLQQRVYIGANRALYFKIDLVLRRSNSGESVCVLDTKYKTGKPQISDIAQVVAYAESKGCRHAGLIYPGAEDQLIDETIGDIRVRSVTFSVEGDLEAAGEQFVNDLLVGLE